ncbi:MAG: pyruvate kinase [Defluviitaleaceae bacterium]|nr:pyruvate kinase [Defluviitaleaceae bacterium]
MRKTKIIATLGPTCNNVATMKEMIKTGMDAARINFSHGTYESREETISMLKEAREFCGVPVPMILDTKGPEIRVKQFKDDKVYLTQGSTFTLTTLDVDGDEGKVSVTYQDLPKDVKPGSRILLDDGLIELVVQSLTDTDIVCKVTNEGFLSSRKGVNVPDVFVNLPSLTEQDISDLKFGIKMGFDYVAASFIRSANDVLNIKEVLQENGGTDIRIIAKIESRDGVNNIDSILEVADGIMVARGDLGVEISPEEVPLVQKQLIQQANLRGKLVITATQMLESMTKNPRPTRAEANDVANAIFDGTDVVMLSGETANGQYPVESISMMARIARQVEESQEYNNRKNILPSYLKKNVTNAISFAACATAKDINAACIVAVTDSGFAASMVARSRPDSPILAITTSDRVCRQLNLTWGCRPMLADNITGSDEVFEVIDGMALKSGMAKTGDVIVALAGVPISTAAATNTLRVLVAGNVLAKGKPYGKGNVKGIARVFKAQEENDCFFEKGDILVATKTSDEMIEYIKLAGALVIGSWEHVDTSHAETVAKALDIPLLISSEKVIDLINDGTAVTVDCNKGLVFNGYR